MQGGFIPGDKGQACSRGRGGDDLGIFRQCRGHAHAGGHAVAAASSMAFAMAFMASMIRSMMN